MRTLLLAVVSLSLLISSLLISGAAQDAAQDQPPSSLDLRPDAQGQLSQEQMRALTRVVAQNYRDNYKKERDYTFIDREVVEKLDGNGGVKSTETKTYEIIKLYGEPVMRLIEKDDKPLEGRDAEKESDRIDKLMAKWRDESDDDRKKREAELEKQRQKNREFVAEVADAYNFRMEPRETLNGRQCWVLSGEPRPEYQPKSREARMLPKFHGRIWIDETELQLVKMDVEAIDTVSFAWGLARLHKGTRFVYEQMRVNDEVWLPEHYEARLDARIGFFKSEMVQNAGTFRDYKKFRTTAKIVGVGEVKHPESRQEAPQP